MPHQQRRRACAQLGLLARSWRTGPPSRLQPGRARQRRAEQACAQRLQARRRAQTDIVPLPLQHARLVPRASPPPRPDRGVRGARARVGALGPAARAAWRQHAVLQRLVCVRVPRWNAMRYDRALCAGAARELGARRRRCGRACAAARGSGEAYTSLDEVRPLGGLPNPSTSPYPSTSPNAGLNPSPSWPNPSPNPDLTSLDECGRGGAGLQQREPRHSSGIRGPNPNPNPNPHGDGLVRHDGRHEKRHKPVADPRRETRPRHTPPLSHCRQRSALRNTPPHATRHGRERQLLRLKQHEKQSVFRTRC